LYLVGLEFPRINDDARSNSHQASFSRLDTIHLEHARIKLTV